MMLRFSLFIFLSVTLQLSIAQTLDAAGKKQGYWKKKDERTNKLVYEGLFKDDKPQGIFKYYYPHDSIKAIMNFKQDGQIAYSTMFHLSTGKKMAYGKYIKELKDSVWTYYDEKGILISRETFLLGKKNGAEYVYFPDGIVSEERHFKMDLQDGTFKLFFDEKNIKGEGTYVKGQLEGKNAYYYPNGTAAAVGYYKNGQKNGPWIYRDNAGKIKEKELYKNGTLASKKETEEFFNKNKVSEEKAPSASQGTTPKQAKPSGTKPQPKPKK